MRGASPELAYPTPGLAGHEGEDTSQNEQRQDSDQETSAIDNPLDLRHPEFSTSAEGTACMYYLILLPTHSFSGQLV